MFTLYRSSAGSGKTFTLVKNYLTIALKHPDRFSSILAITFTNKAAAEMKLRIMRSLHNYLKIGSDPIVDAIVSEEKWPERQVISHAEFLMDRILHRYSDFSVLTIDAFISRVVRTFARDLELPLKYDIELETAYITRDVIERILSEACEGSFTGEMLKQFALNKINHSGSWSLDSDLLGLGQIAFNEQHLFQRETLARAGQDNQFWHDLVKILNESMNQFVSTVHALAEEGLKLMQAYQVTVDDFKGKSKGGFGQLLIYYSTASHPEKLEPNAKLVDGPFEAATASADCKARVQAAMDGGLRKAAQLLYNYLEASYPVYVSQWLVHKNIYTQALTGKFLYHAERYKTEKNRLPLGDFALKVSGVIRNEPIPFIYWRLGNRYSNIMVDEFQDTSRLQWTNLRPLIEEALSNGYGNLAVGDGKQAIYRWRAGDVAIMEEDLPADLATYLSEEVLACNYRSRPQVVEFNNRLFTELYSHFSNQSIPYFEGLYKPENVVQQVKRNTGGLVKLQKVDISEVKRRHEKNERILTQLAVDIESVLAEGNGYRYGDMAVLVRSNSQAAAVAQALFSRDIPVVSPDSLQLKSSPVVQFIVAVLRYIVTDDRRSLYAMWHFLNFDAITFYRLIQNPDGLKFIHQSIHPEFSKLRYQLLRRPVLEAVEEVVLAFRLNEEHHGFIQGLQEVVLGFTEKFTSNTAAFLDWWDENKDTDKATLTSGAVTDAVHISTIHKSKGLEYPIVFLPFSWNLTDNVKSGEFLWVQCPGLPERFSHIPFMASRNRKLFEKSVFSKHFVDEEAASRLDNINLLYVALTRAAHRLYLYAEKSDKDVSDETPANTADLLAAMAEKAGLKTADDQTFESGDITPAYIQRAEGQGEQWAVLPAQDWRSKITLKRRGNEMWRLENGPASEKIEYGLLIHEILADVEEERHIHGAMNQQIRQGHCSAQDAQLIEQLIDKLMDVAIPGGGLVRQWFLPPWRVMNECAIATETGELRPDRVLLHQKQAIVIDYKTGLPFDHHHDQVKNYMTVLSEMGYEMVKGYLLYTQSLQVSEVI